LNPGPPPSFQTISFAQTLLFRHYFQPIRITFVFAQLAAQLPGQNNEKTLLIDGLSLHR
jgi:hypothetical protein